MHISYDFLVEANRNSCEKNSKKSPKLFHYDFTVNFFKQKRPECPFKSAIIAGLGPGPSVFGFPDLLNPIYALGLAIIAGLDPGSPVREFLSFFDPIHSPKYTGSTTALADLSPVFCSYAVKRFVFDTFVTSYLFVLVSLCDNLCVLFPNESYYCTQKFFFFEPCIYNISLRVIKNLSLLLFVYQ